MFFMISLSFSFLVKMISISRCAGILLPLPIIPFGLCRTKNLFLAFLSFLLIGTSPAKPLKWATEVIEEYIAIDYYLFYALKKRAPEIVANRVRM